MHSIREALSIYFAAISIYTRLPVWRLMPLDESHYRRAINALPWVSLLTGGLMAVVFTLCSLVLHLPLLVSLGLAMLARLGLTGAFHEDGLGDFFDGFGGGRDRESILRIMKDSHVGSYAVLAYIVYYALWLGVVLYLPLRFIPILLLIADIYGKLAAQALVQYLPYARPESESKTSIVYHPTARFVHLFTLALLIALSYCIDKLLPLTFALPTLFVLVFARYIRAKIGGYTGDTCGAIILMAELLCLLSTLLLLSNNILQL